MEPAKVLREAEFDRTVIKYWLISGTIVMVVCVVTIPLLPVWWILASIFCKRYLDRMECQLTERSLEIKRGLIVRVEKTIPLEKITDLAMFQGPIMRAMDLRGFKIETAGGGGGTTGYLASLTGIVDTPGFREAVLRQRDLVVEGRGADIAAAQSAGASIGGESVELLREMSETLKRIEQKLGQS